MRYEDISGVISQIEGESTATIETITEVKLKGGKKNPFQGRVQKRTVNAKVLLNNGSPESSYANKVKEQMVSEGKDPDTFVLKPRAWGERIGNTPFIEHKGKQYIECIFISGGDSVYLVDGTETPKDEIEGLEPTDKTPAETSQGGIEKKIVLRTFSLDSIQSLTIQ